MGSCQSPILLTTVILTRLTKPGYQSMLDYYLKVSPSVDEPPYTRLLAGFFRRELHSD